MERDVYLDHLARDGELLAEAVAGQDLSAAVPACPGWTAKDLVEHVAEVYEHKMRGMIDGEPPGPWPPEWPADRDPLEWFRDAHARIQAELRSRSPEEPTPTWYPPDQTVGFWVRRMAQETAVHRVDAQAAYGEAGPVDAQLAIDGIDEVLFVMLLGDWSDDPEPPEETTRVSVRGGGETFDVTIAPAEVSVVRRPSDDGEAFDATITPAGTAAPAEGEEKFDVNIVAPDVEVVPPPEGEPTADATISGDPSAVLLWLWGRAGHGAVSLEGDQDAVAEFRRRLAIATE